MFLAIFHFDELLLTCWSAINHLDCMSKSTFPSKFFFSWFFICPHFFLICLFLSWSLFFFSFFLILFSFSLSLWFLFIPDHLPLLIIFQLFFVCARHLLFIFFLILNISHLLQSRSIFHETKSFSCFFLFSKEKGRRCQFDPYLYSHYLDWHCFHSDIWYFDNFKLIICWHCNHSLILQVDYFSVPGKVIIVLLFNHNHCHISLEALYCCCNHLQPGLRLLTFSCNFLKYASGIVVQGPFVSIYQVHFSQRFYWPSLVWAATSPKKGSFSDRTSGMTIPDGWLTRTF